MSNEAAKVQILKDAYREWHESRGGTALHFICSEEPMTGDQARALEPGNYVRWTGPGEVSETGVVVAVYRFSVSIRWADGRLTEPLFNDMRKMSQTDINGRLI